MRTRKVVRPRSGTELTSGRIAARRYLRILPESNGGYYSNDLHQKHMKRAEGDERGAESQLCSL